VFRVTVLSIVLALAVSPNARLLCQAPCDRGSTSEPAAEECHHIGLPINRVIVATDDTCNTLVLGVAPFITEDTQRPTLAPTGQQGVLVSRYQLTQATAGDGPPVHPAIAWAFEKRPLSIARRI